MMSESIQKAVQKRPFQPFRVRLHSGESLDVTRRFRATVFEPMVVFGVNDDPKTGLPQNMRIINIADIAGVEDLPSAT
jgi:hypothetical protein